MSAVPARSTQSVVGVPAVVIASMTAAQPLLQERIASHGHDEEHGRNVDPEFEVDEVIGSDHVKYRRHPFLRFSLVGGPRSGGKSSGRVGARGPAEKNPVFCLDLESSLGELFARSKRCGETASFAPGSLSILNDQAARTDRGRSEALSPSLPIATRPRLGPLAGSRLQEQKQHDHRSPGLDCVAKPGRHLDPGAGLGLDRVVAQGERRLAANDLQDSRLRGSVLSQLLMLIKAENNGLELLVVVDCPAQDTFGRRLRLCGQVCDVGICWVHIDSLSNSNMDENVTDARYEWTMTIRVMNTIFITPPPAGPACNRTGQSAGRSVFRPEIRYFRHNRENFPCPRETSRGRQSRCPVSH